MSSLITIMDSKIHTALYSKNLVGFLFIYCELIKTLEHRKLFLDPFGVKCLQALYADAYAAMLKYEHSCLIFFSCCDVTAWRFYHHEHQFLPTLSSDATHQAAQPRRRNTHATLDVHKILSGESPPSPLKSKGVVVKLVKARQSLSKQAELNKKVEQNRINQKWWCKMK